MLSKFRYKPAQKWLIFPNKANYARGLLTSFLALTLFGCATKKQEPHKPKPLSVQAFRMNLHSEPASLDPRMIRDIPTLTVGKMFFDGLTRATLNGEILPSIANKISLSYDKKTYTFYLRDTFWSNGLPVTAYDFEYAWKKVLSKDFPAEYSYQLFTIKNGELAKQGIVSPDKIGVRADGAKKLIVELENPNPYFLELTSFPICYPIPSQLEKNNPSWATSQGNAFVCNGPFCLVKWTHGSELRAEKNPLYWEADKVKLHSVVLTMIEDEHTELNMYENEELDWAGSPNSSIPPEALPSLKNNQKGQNELHILPIAGTFCYKFNTKVEPFNSIKMRKAFAYAINRESLVNNVLQANQIVAKALLPPCMKGEYENERILFSDVDKEKAVALFEEALAEANWTRETMPPITLIFSKSEKHQKIAQAVQQEWNNTFNIKVNLQSYEWNTFLEHLAKGNFQVGGKGWISDLSDPKTLLEIYKFANDGSTGNNDTGWEHPEFIRLMNLTQKTVDPKERQKLLLDAERILIDEMPIAPLYHSTACYLKKPYVKDVYISKLCDIDLKHTYIER